MAAHNDLGRWGEEQAVSFLEEQGYEILERDWKSGHLDIDIVARDGNTLVIVEVKTRRNRLFGAPEESIDYKKQLNLQRAMNHYLKSHHTGSDVRFDIISIVGTIGSKPEIDHIKDVTII